MSGSNYIWHVLLHDQWATVVVLAWHEGTATVMPLDEQDQYSEGDFPLVVRLNELRFGRPPEPVAVAS